MITAPPHQLLPILTSYLPENPLIIEAGAFWGHDSLKMAEQWPKGTVYAFEPVPEIFNELVKRTSHVSNIICHQQALSDTDDLLLLHLAYKKNRISQATSVHQPHQRLQLSPITFPKQITVSATTLTSFMHMNNLSAIDLLWLDLQGHEYNVLSHNTTLLRSIKFLHVEVYFVQAYKDHLLYHDVIRWLETHNFTIIAKDFANEKDNFFGNILCMQKNFTL